MSSLIRQRLDALGRNGKEGKSAEKGGFAEASPEEIRELLELVARALRPVYPLETDCGFDELLRAIDRP